MAFTAKELEEELIKVENIDRDFPELPIVYLMPYQEFWREDNFPITLKKVGTSEKVTVSVKEFIGGDEAGPMSIILQTGFGSGARYFLKSGYYDSWDNGNDDYQWDGGFVEVESREIKRTEWVTKE